jgi:Cu(I)/Ag(I) efflux system membrane fusion protein
MTRHDLTRLIVFALSVVLLTPQAAMARDDAGREILYWVAPMDPNYRRDKPGKSPMGMDLVPVYADAHDEPGHVVSIDPAIVQNLGVRTAPVERSRLWRGINTVGYVDYDESKTSHIHLRTEGWIERLDVESEGERVRKGQRLFELYSPALVNAQEEFIQALKIGNTGLEQASRDRLSALGIPEDQIRQLKKDQRARQTIAIYAPQDGVVSTLPVREGMFVKPADRVMSLAELSSVWLLAEVFERQADWVRVGQPAEVRLPYLPARTWEGRVEYIYPSLDPKTRTLKVRLRFDNPEEALKPNMYAHVRIFGGPKENTIVIPLEALIRTGREERVILSLGEGRFESRTVTAGIESGDWVEILSGIDAGDDVVVSGQFLIDSEASLKASMQRMGSPGHNHAAGQP